MKSGFLDKKKVGAKKWEYRFCLFTMGHLVWFEDFEAREKQKPKGVIDLNEVRSVTMKQLEGEASRGDVIHLDIGGVVYVFGDASKTVQNKQWKEQIDFVLTQMEQKRKRESLRNEAK
jgi:hypothetical protein